MNKTISFLIFIIESLLEKIKDKKNEGEHIEAINKVLLELKKKDINEERLKEAGDRAGFLAKKSDIEYKHYLTDHILYAAHYAANCVSDPEGAVRDCAFYACNAFGFIAASSAPKGEASNPYYYKAREEAERMLFEEERMRLLK